MDNRIISIQSEGRKDFNLAFQLMFNNNCVKATHYFEHPDKGLILLWHECFFNEIKVCKLPHAMEWKAAADLAWDWMSKRKDGEYQDWCDHDGDDGHGFRIYNEAWRQVAGSPYAILAVLPIWAWYGK
jgi:hypothetical protein